MFQYFLLSVVIHGLLLGFLTQSLGSRESHLFVETISISLGEKNSSYSATNVHSKKNIKIPVPKGEGKLKPYSAAALADQNERESSGKNQAQIRGGVSPIQVEIHPVYPKLSRRLGEEGVVVVHLILSPDGKLVEADILKSSGYARLDQAALEGVQSAVFQVNQEVKEQLVKNVNIVFKLNE
jgi:TonB family protein